MGSDAQKPEYTGMDKYPGWIATILTVVIGAVFILALVNEANHGHHDSHGENHSADHGADGADHGKEGSQDQKGAH